MKNIYFFKLLIKFLANNVEIIVIEVIIFKGDGHMDIAALSVSMKQASLYQQIGIALTKKVMDTNEVNLQALMKIMESSVNPNLGKNIDVSV